MESIPLELWIHHIFNHIDTTSVVRSMRVSKYWKESIEQVLPHLDIDVSGNQFISDDNLEIFSENKSLKLSNCSHFLGQATWYLMANKINIQNCYNIGDCVFKYITLVKELIVDYDQHGYYINNKIFSNLEKLSAKNEFSNCTLKIYSPNLKELILNNFIIDRDLFDRYQNLTTIHLIDCTFSEKINYYCSNDVKYCKNVKSIIFDKCCDENYYYGGNEFETIMLFINKYLPVTCSITFNFIDDRKNKLENVSKEEFLKLIKHGYL